MLSSRQRNIVIGKKSRWNSLKPIGLFSDKGPQGKPEKQTQQGDSRYALSISGNRQQELFP